MPTKGNVGLVQRMNDNTTSSLSLSFRSVFSLDLSQRKDWKETSTGVSNSFPVSKRDSRKRCVSLYRYRQLLFPGNGGSDSTDSASFRLRESGGSDSTVLSPALLRFVPVISSRSTLLLFPCPIDSRSENLYDFSDRSKMIVVVF